MLCSRMSVGQQFASATVLLCLCSSANLRESQRLCVIIDPIPASPLRAEQPAKDARILRLGRFLAASPEGVRLWRTSRRSFPVATFGPSGDASSCNSQLQLAAFLRSVDCRGLMSNLSPFKINTYRNFCTFCISLIRGHLKSSIINTSVNFDFKLPIINTSKKKGGGGSSCNSSCTTPRSRHGELAAIW